MKSGNDFFGAPALLQWFAVSGSILFVIALLVLIALGTPAQTPQSGQPPASTFAQGQKAKVKGLILSRHGDNMTIRSESGAPSVVTLTDETEISSPKGLLKLRKKQRDVTSLLPGLRVEVEGVGDSQGQLVANKITFDSDDLKVAQQISAGQTELQAQQKQTQEQTELNRANIAMLSKRLSEMDEYDVKYSAVVHFTTGSSALNSEGKRTLDDLVQKGKGTQGYLVEVAGFADTTGSEARNQELSKRRAESVVAYLEEVRNVPLRRILTPAGLGTSHEVAANVTAAGRAANRRVEVKVLVNKGEN